MKVDPGSGAGMTDPPIVTPGHDPGSIPDKDGSRIKSGMTVFRRDDGLSPG